MERIRAEMKMEKKTTNKSCFIQLRLTTWRHLPYQSTSVVIRAEIDKDLPARVRRISRGKRLNGRFGSLAARCQEFIVWVIGLGREVCGGGCYLLSFECRPGCTGDIVDISSWHHRAIGTRLGLIYGRSICVVLVH
jgi:hypothetical protein